MKRIIRSLLLFALAPAAFALPSAAGVLPDELDGAEPAGMMRAYLRGHADEAFERRDERYEAMTSPEDIEAYQVRMRAFFLEQLGGWPERTPLNARVVGEERLNGVRVQKVIYESRPGHSVTAAMYLPNTPPPWPGVLIPCGHAAPGKAYEYYQKAGFLLALNGMAALCYDPIDQGERFQLLDGDGEPVIGGTDAHTMIGVGSILLGHNAASFRVWDGVRGIDYLQSRDDIIDEKIGCTGNSGGGTLTSYLMALDDRVACAAPSCYITTLRMQPPQDAEQNIHDQIIRGMDHADYIMMRAPKPTLICAATRDFFPILGTWQAFREAKRLYTRLDFPERVELAETDGEHGFTQQLREAMARWMSRWLLDKDVHIMEPPLDILSEEQMRCVPGGQVMLRDGERSVYDINRETAEGAAAERAAFLEGADDDALRDAVRETAGIRPLNEIPRPELVSAGSESHDGYEVEHWIAKPEAGVWLPVNVYIPDNDSGGACLYVHGESKEADAGPDGPIMERVKNGAVVAAVDVRGTGETSPPEGGGGLSAHFGPDWQEIFLAYQLDRPYVGMRTEDILVCARELSNLALDGGPVELVAVGEAGVPALHAAALEPELFKKATLRNSPVSWSECVESGMTRNQLVNAVHGVLRRYDLPDLEELAGADRLEIVQPADAMGRPAN